MGDRFDIIEKSEPMGIIHAMDVSCAPGDYLLRGSCTLEEPDSHTGLTMFRAGFASQDQNRPNTWQCGWNNTSGASPIATATAICLKSM